MFFSVKKFMRDVEFLYLVYFGGGSVAVLDPEGSRSQVVVKVCLQVILTLAVALLCLWVVVTPDPSETSVRLAHSGFGLILGYWFR